MAKIVSTKFGDRRLVYLPPINLKKTKTPNVETIVTDRQVPDRHRRNTSAVSIMPKEYAYNKRSVEKNDAWLGGPVRSTLEGNIVTEYPRALGDQIFEQLYQQASTDTMANYSQGQFPVLPPVGEAPQQMQYTNYGLHNTAQQQPVSNFPVDQPTPVQQQQQQPLQGQNPNEKHIYYGPNGEVLPGPPRHACCIDGRERTQDFAFEGLLYFGRLRGIQLIESISGFPKIPDYLTKDLLEKYGQYEQTTVRVVCRHGRCYVHATPLIRQNPRFQPPAKPEFKYVPVYLNEDEEFDYDKFMAEYGKGYHRKSYHPGASRYGRRQNALPPPSREIVHRALRPDIYDDFDHPRPREPLSPRVSRRSVYRSDFARPNTYDNFENLRWRKNDDGHGIASRRTAPSNSVYRTFDRRGMRTRYDIKPLEEIDRYYRK